MNPAVPNRQWHPLLTAVIVLFLALTGWSILQAQRQVSSVTDRDYYSHGLRYNQTALERKAAQSLGWALNLQLDGRFLVSRLTDEVGRPVTGGNGGLLLLGSGAVDRPQAELPFQEVAPGLYRVQLPEQLQGQVPAQVTLTSAGASIQRRLLLNL